MPNESKSRVPKKSFFDFVNKVLPNSDIKGIFSPYSVVMPLLIPFCITKSLKNGWPVFSPAPDEFNLLVRSLEALKIDYLFYYDVDSEETYNEWKEQKTSPTITISNALDLIANSEIGQIKPITVMRSTPEWQLAREHYEDFYAKNPVRAEVRKKILANDIARYKRNNPSANDQDIINHIIPECIDTVYYSRSTFLNGLRTKNIVFYPYTFYGAMSHAYQLIEFIEPKVENDNRSELDKLYALEAFIQVTYLPSELSDYLNAMMSAASLTTNEKNVPTVKPSEAQLDKLTQGTYKEPVFATEQQTNETIPVSREVAQSLSNNQQLFFDTVLTVNRNQGLHRDGITRSLPATRTCSPLTDSPNSCRSPKKTKSLASPVISPMYDENIKNKIVSPKQEDNDSMIHKNTTFSDLITSTALALITANSDANLTSEVIYALWKKRVTDPDLNKENVLSSPELRQNKIQKTHQDQVCSLANIEAVSVTDLVDKSAKPSTVEIAAAPVSQKSPHSPTLFRNAVVKTSSADNLVSKIQLSKSAR